MPVDYTNPNRIRKRDEKQKNIQSIGGYNNEVNPFNDDQLTEKFVWKKNKRRKAHHNDEDGQLAQQRAQEEIKRLKEKRLRREIEQRAIEEQRLERERQIELQNRKESDEEFILKQLQLKSEIRLKEGKATSIDLIVCGLKTIVMLKAYQEQESSEIKKENLTDTIAIVKDDDQIMDINRIELSAIPVPLTKVIPPNEFLPKLKADRLKEIIDEIDAHVQLDYHFGNSYWKAFKQLAHNELAKRELTMEMRSLNMHEEVEEELETLFEGKTLQELETMEEEMNQEMRDDPDADIDFFESTLKKLASEKDKLFILSVHSKMDEAIQWIIQERGEQIEQVKEDAPLDLKQKSQKSSDIPYTTDRRYYINNYAAEDPKHQLHHYHQRRRVQQLAIAPYRELFDNQRMKDLMLEETMVKIAKKSMKHIEPMNDDFEIESRHLNVTNYEPIKPNYICGAIVGVEWTTYTRTHYDNESNPPPKTIQGYRFNIFYPDLFDTSVIPKYKVLKGKTRDEQTIVFTAGAPYKDIAFTIQDRGQWGKSPKFGFVYSINKGLLQLYFRFKRRV